MKCQFDSSPTPIIQWVKMNRMVRRSDDGQIILEGHDPQIIEILTRQISSTFYETQLTVPFFVFIFIFIVTFV
jgi:uncharacterized membrane protein